MTSSTDNSHITDQCVGGLLGVEPAPFTRTAGLGAWNRFAAVNDEFVDIHMDDEAGQAAGYPGAIGMGNLMWSWFHCMLDGWLGEHGRVIDVALRFRRPALKGMTVTCHGAVTATAGEGNENTIELEIWAEDEDGDRLAVGTARVATPVENPTQAGPAENLAR